MPLDGLAGMPELSKVPAGSFAIGSVGFLGAIERSDMNYATRAETGTEAAGSRSLYPLGKTTHPPLVLHVLCSRGSAQIDPAVVISDAIDVIDLRRFLTGDHLEDDTVNRPQAMIEFDKRVADVVVVPGDVPRIPGVPSFPFFIALEVFSGTDLPSQDPTYLRIAETCLQISAIRQDSIEARHA